MKEKNFAETELGREQSKLLERATTFSEDRQFLAAFHMAARSPELQEIALKDPLEFLKSQHLEMPKGLTIKFFAKPRRVESEPDFEFFTIRLYKCRTYWVKKKNGPGFEKGEVCFGFEIVPHRYQLNQ
jgi:hypothetical protein